MPWQYVQTFNERTGRREKHLCLCMYRVPTWHLFKIWISTVTFQWAYVTWCSHYVKWCSYYVTWCSHYVTWCSHYVTWCSHYVTWCSHYVTWCSHYVNRCSNYVTWCSNYVTWCSHYVTWCSHYFLAYGKAIQNVYCRRMEFCLIGCSDAWNDDSATERSAWRRLLRVNQAFVQHHFRATYRRTPAGIASLWRLEVFCVGQDQRMTVLIAETLWGLGKQLLYF